MAARKTGQEPKPDHPATKPSAAVVVVLDDGSTIEYATEADARAAHPRAWVRPKREVEDDGEEHV